MTDYSHLVVPNVYTDGRGYFMEFWRANNFPVQFVQDNQSGSVRNTIRGLHYNIEKPQAKLVRCLSGTIFDVTVDMREDSPNFGRWDGFTISANNHYMVYVPAGYAHGFAVLSDYAEIMYKCSDYYHPDGERVLLWNDPAVGIRWPVAEPVLSPRDAAGLAWAAAPKYEVQYA